MAIEIEAKRPVDEIESTSEQPLDKKQKTTPNLDALKKQVEYYLSDANLKHDKFFHTKISEEAEGWLPITHLLACNKMKTLTTEVSVVAEAVRISAELEVNESGDAVRRKTPLPTFEGELKRASLKNKDKNPAIYKKQISIGEFKFPNLTAAKKRVGEILKSRRAGVIFKEGTPDYNLVLAVLAEHPNATTKMAGMTGLKVDTAPQGESRCFFIVKGENKDEFEDISIVKAFANFEGKLIESLEKSATVPIVEKAENTPTEVESKEIAASSD